MTQVLKKEMDCSYEEAVDRVKEIVSEKFSILMVKSVDEIIRKNMDLPDYPLQYTTILACGADLAKMALDVSPDVGTVMPCSFTVYEENGKVFANHISIMKIAQEIGIADKDKMEPVIEKTGERVRSVWDKI